MIEVDHVPNFVDMLSARLREAFVQIGKVFIDVVLNIWNSLKEKLGFIQSQFNKMHKDTEKYIHNQYTRSTWTVEWDSRRSNQVINNKPRLSVAHRNR